MHEANIQQQKKEKEDFLKLVYSQFNQTIITPIIEFAEKVNEQYAGNDKLTFHKNIYFAPDQTEFSWKLSVPPNNEITINFEIILEENFVRTNVKKGQHITITETHGHIPQYNRKNILAWGAVINSYNYGFNFFLLDGGDIYGDWFVMKNHNNFSYATYDKERREPFAFTVKELRKELDLLQVTHLYCSTFEELDSTSFLKYIKELSFDLK